MIGEPSRNHDSSPQSAWLQCATAAITTLGNIPLALSAVTIISGSFTHHSSDVVFGVGLGVVPLVAAWASVRLLTRRLRQSKGALLVHLAAVVVCSVINFFAAGFATLGGAGLAASAFLLAVGLQAIGFVLGVILLIKLYRQSARSRAGPRHGEL